MEAAQPTTDESLLAAADDALKRLEEEEDPDAVDVAAPLPRAALKLYNSALDRDAGIDLRAIPVAASRLVLFHDLVERDRAAAHDLRPPKALPTSSSPRAVTSPRTRAVSTSLANRNRQQTGPVQVRSSIMAAIRASLPLSVRDGSAKKAADAAGGAASSSSSGST